MGLNLGVKENDLHQSSQNVAPSQIKKEIPKPKSSEVKKKDIIGEYLAFNDKGEKLCASGEKGDTWRIKDSTKCEKEGMKKYVVGDEKTSHRLGLKFKHKGDGDGSGARQFLMTIGGIKVLGIKTAVDGRSYWKECSYGPHQINDGEKNEGGLVGCHKVNNLQ